MNGHNLKDTFKQPELFRLYKEEKLGKRNRKAFHLILFQFEAL